MAKNKRLEKKDAVQNHNKEDSSRFRAEGVLQSLSLNRITCAFLH